MDEQGVPVAEPTVRACVARVRRELEFGRVAVPVPQLHRPSAEAEVDLGRVSVSLDGALTELSMFRMRLSHSGCAAHVCFPSEGQEAFLEDHVIALERFGGVPGRLRYDNLKAAEARVLDGRGRVESDRLDDQRHIAGRMSTVGQMVKAERLALRPLPAEPFDPTGHLRVGFRRRSTKCSGDRDDHAASDPIGSD